VKIRLIGIQNPGGVPRGASSNSRAACIQRLKRPETLLWQDCVSLPDSPTEKGMCVLDCVNIAILTLWGIVIASISSFR